MFMRLLISKFLYICEITDDSNFSPLSEYAALATDPVGSVTLLFHTPVGPCPDLSLFFRVLVPARFLAWLHLGAFSGSMHV